MKQLLDNICRAKLTDDKITDDEKRGSLEKICEEIITYYKKHEDRHSYTEVSIFVYEMIPDYYEYLMVNLDTIIEHFKSDNENRKYAEKIFKLKDHITLESARESHIKEEHLNDIQIQLKSMLMSTLSGHTAQISKEKEELKTIFEQQKKEFEKQEDAISSMNTQIVSILGIFGAIIIAFIGGLTALSSIFENIHQGDIYRILFVAIIVGFIMFNLIFMLLHSISKIIGKPISNKCRFSDSCDECINRKDIKLICVEEKYPAVFWFNSVCFILVMVIGIALIQHKYNVVGTVIELIKQLYNINQYLFILTILIILILLMNITFIIKERFNIFSIYKDVKDEIATGSTEISNKSGDDTQGSSCIAITQEKQKNSSIFKANIECLKNKYPAVYKINQIGIVLIISIIIIYEISILK